MAKKQGPTRQQGQRIARQTGKPNWAGKLRNIYLLYRQKIRARNKTSLKNLLGLQEKSRASQEKSDKLIIANQADKQDLARQQTRQQPRNTYIIFFLSKDINNILKSRIS